MPARFHSKKLNGTPLILPTEVVAKGGPTPFTTSPRKKKKKGGWVIRVEKGRTDSQINSKNPPISEVIAFNEEGSYARKGEGGKPKDEKWPLL